MHAHSQEKIRLTLFFISNAAPFSTSSFAASRWPYEAVLCSEVSFVIWKESIKINGIIIINN